MRCSTMLRVDARPGPIKGLLLGGLLSGAAALASGHEVVTDLYDATLASAPEARPNQRSSGSLGLVLERSDDGWLRVLGAGGESGWVRADEHSVAQMTVAVSSNADVGASSVLPDADVAPQWASLRDNASLQLLGASEQSYRYDPAFFQSNGLANHLPDESNPYAAPMLKVAQGTANGWAVAAELAIDVPVQSVSAELTLTDVCESTSFAGIARAPFIAKFQAPLRRHLLDASLPTTRLDGATGPARDAGDAHTLICAPTGDTGVALFAPARFDGSSVLALWHEGNARRVMLPRDVYGVTSLTRFALGDLDADGQREWMLGLAFSTSHGNTQSLWIVPAERAEDGARRVATLDFGGSGDAAAGASPPTWWFEARTTAGHLWLAGFGADGRGVHAARLRIEPGKGLVRDDGIIAVSLGDGIDAEQARRLALQYEGAAALSQGKEQTKDQGGSHEAPAWQSLRLFNSRKAAQRFVHSRRVGSEPIQTTPFSGNSIQSTSFEIQ